MRIRTAFAIISALAVSGLASAQGNLTIGDKAPALPVAGFIKGDKIDHLEKGKTYVIEFWATWCGPCIASMPHLSELADKYRGKVEFIGINSFDIAKISDKLTESSEQHSKRITQWVHAHSEIMRYQVVLDDQKSTIANSWLIASGQTGIPCSYIVNKEGLVAWIGHPNQIASVLEEILDNVWDLDGFKKTYEITASKARAELESERAFAAAIKKGDQTYIENYIASGSEYRVPEILKVIEVAATYNPAIAFQFFIKYNGKLPKVPLLTYCELASRMASGIKDPLQKLQLIALSQGDALKVDVNLSAIAFVYHALVLNLLDRQEEALRWVDKARLAAQNIVSTENRGKQNYFIDTIVKRFK